MDKRIEERVERTKLRPAEIKDLMPLNDGYTYYQSFGEAVAKAQINKFLNEPDLALIDRRWDWSVNPYEIKWRKAYGGDIDHYRDLMDGYEKCREAVIPLECLTLIIVILYTDYCPDYVCHLFHLLYYLI